MGQESAERTLKINLSNDMVNGICKIAETHGMAVGEIIENFIKDLVQEICDDDCTDTPYAQKWFKRCWRRKFPHYTFVRYLVENNMLEDVMKECYFIESCKSSIKMSEEGLKTGVMRDGEIVYTWDELVRTDGSPSYSSKEEWEEKLKEDIRQDYEEITDRQSTLNNYWSEYLEENDSYKNGSFEEEMKNVTDFYETYKRLSDYGFCADE